MTEERVDHQMRKAFQDAVAMYEVVFGETPDTQIRFLSGGDPALVVADWLWLFQSTRDGRWTVRSIIPEDPWWQQYKCLSRTHGYEVERHSMTDTVRVLLEWETHRRFHQAVETVRRTPTRSRRPCGLSHTALA